MDLQRCHHCNSVGHKKFDCTERCRVGCNWCERPPARRRPAFSKNNLDSQQRQNGKRNVLGLSGGNGQANGPTNNGPSSRTPNLDRTNSLMARTQNLGPPSSGWPVVTQQQPTPSPQTLFLQTPSQNLQNLQKNIQNLNFNSQTITLFPQLQLNTNNSTVTQPAQPISIPLKPQQQQQPPTQQLIPNWSDSTTTQQPQIQQSLDTGNDNKLPYSNVNQLHQLQTSIFINNPHLSNEIDSITQETYRSQVRENLINQSNKNSQNNYVSGPQFNNVSGPQFNNVSGPQFNNVSGPQNNNVNGPQNNNVNGPQNNNVNGQPVNGDCEKNDPISLKDGRKHGNSSIEIINKLKLLKNKIELGLHPRIRPSKSSWIPQFPYYKITKENNLKIGVNAPRELPKRSGHFNNFVEIKIEDSKAMQKSKNLSFENMSSNMTPIEDANGDRPVRGRRNRSPRLSKGEINFDYYHSPPEFQRMEKYNRSRSSRSPSPRRSFPEFGSTSRPINEFDERYCSRNPGTDYREKYYSRNQEYEDYYTRYMEKQPERGGYQFRNADRDPNLYRMRSRSPAAPHSRINIDNYSRRVSGGNGWYGDEMYDERDYRPGTYYDRSFPPRPEVERSYVERDEFLSRRRTNERW
ncbi:8123_t:CDS:2 [Diversispora eburnea]|uniref:8123_t:CDS:1 n=1 Tax=Diversispora eburnea TaxID=1213867 RepID=A0A9N8ZFI2_9GLOM|nr:8123_t:CDS:2 [Diversispora eburnea]